MLTNNELRDGLKAIQSHISSLVEKMGSDGLSIQETYGKPFEQLTAPEGYRFKLDEHGKPVFRSVAYPDSFLARGEMLYSGRSLAVDGIVVNGPRLILEKIDPPKIGVYTEIQDIYGKPFGDLTPPSGYEFVVDDRGHPALVIPVSMETWYFGVDMLAWKGTNPNRRLWLRKKPDPTPTIESIYGKPFSQLKPPVGYTWLLDDKGEPVFKAAGWVQPWLDPSPSIGGAVQLEVNAPRLHLRRLRRWLLEETGETRVPKSGEYIIMEDGSIHKADFYFTTTRYPILRLVHKPE